MKFLLVTLFSWLPRLHVEVFFFSFFFFSVHRKVSSTYSWLVWTLPEFVAFWCRYGRSMVDVIPELNFISLQNCWLITKKRTLTSWWESLSQKRLEIIQSMTLCLAIANPCEFCLKWKELVWSQMYQCNSLSVSLKVLVCVPWELGGCGGKMKVKSLAKVNTSNEGRFTFRNKWQETANTFRQIILFCCFK